MVLSVTPGIIPTDFFQTMHQNAAKSVGLVLVLWLAGLGAAAQFAKISIILPELRLVYPEAEIMLGFAVSLLSFMGIILGLFTGLIAVRMGYRKLLILSLAIGTIVSLIQAVLPPINILLLTRLVEGLSHLGIVVAAPTLIAQIASDRHRPLAMTLWGTFFGVAFAIVAWLGAPLVEAFGPSSLFIAHGLYMMAVLILLWTGLAKSRNNSIIRERLNWKVVLDRHRSIYTSPFISAPALGWLFYTITFVALLTVLPDTVAPEHREFISGLMPLASIASSMTLGVFLLRVITAIQLIIFGFVTAIIICAFLIIMPGDPYLCIALLGALGLVQGASFASIPHLNSKADDQAFANGAMAQMGNVGNAVGTPLLLALLFYMNFQTMIIIVMACYVMGIGVHILMQKLRNSGKHE